MNFSFNLTSEELVIQALGFLGFGIYAIAANCRCRRRLFTQEAAGAGLIGIHVLMLGNVIGMIINGIYMAMSIIGRLHPEVRVTMRVMVVLFLSMGVATAFTWTNQATDYFCAIGTITGLFARGIKNPIGFRATAGLSTAIWMGFNILVNSWAGVAFGLISIFGHSKEIYRAVKQKVPPCEAVPAE